jgi:hypothetical protein
LALAVLRFRLRFPAARPARFPSRAAGGSACYVANVMPDDRPIASPPNPASETPPSKHRLIGRALFWAFLSCFLWLLLTALFSHLVDITPRPYDSIIRVIDRVVSRLGYWTPLVIASVILYPACFTKRSPVFRAFMVLLISVALFICAVYLWIVILRPSFGDAP